MVISMLPFDRGRGNKSFTPVCGRSVVVDSLQISVITERMEAMRRRTGFTLLELVVVAAMVALLSAVVVPAICFTKNISKIKSCRSNQKKVSRALFMYAEDNDDQIPYYISMPDWVADGRTNDLTWDLVIGAVPVDQMPENMRDHATSYYEQTMQICSDGYIDYPWMEREGTYFNCPAAFDQIRYKPPMSWDYPRTTSTVDDGEGGFLPAGQPTLAGWGCHFSINGLVSELFRARESDEVGLVFDEPLTCVRLSDVRPKAVLIGDGNVRGGGNQLLFRSSYPTSSTYGLNTYRARTDAERVGFAGPWTVQTDSELGYGIPIDFYGHAKRRTVLTYADGHVAETRRVRASDWIIDPNYAGK